MKALFIINPHFRSLIDIEEPIIEYRFAILEESHYFHGSNYGSIYAMPSSTKQLIFRIATWESITIKGELMHIPVYQFSRME